jgi:TolB-like protein
MRYLMGIILACALWAQGANQDRLAVLSIQNTTRTESSFVEAMPDMIVSELLRIAPDLQLVERRQVEAAIKELQLDIGGLTEEGGRRVGQWVGAERILVGTLSSLGSSMRLDLRVIQVESGRIVQAGNATVDRESLVRLIPSAVMSLQTPAPSGQKPVVLPVAEPRVATVPTEVREAGHASVRIRYRAVLSLFTQKSVPLQKVRVYANNKLLGESPVLDAVNKDFYVYNGAIPAGTVELRLEHGMVNKSGEWKGLLPEQPETSILTTKAGDHVELNYRLKVGNGGLKFTEL